MDEIDFVWLYVGLGFDLLTYRSLGSQWLHDIYILLTGKVYVHGAEKPAVSPDVQHMKPVAIGSFLFALV